MRGGGTLQSSVCSLALLTEQSPEWSLQRLSLHLEGRGIASCQEISIYLTLHPIF